MNTTTASATTRPAGSEDHPAGRGLPRRRFAGIVAAATAAALSVSLTGCVSVQLPAPAPSTTLEHEVSADVHAVHLDTAGDLTITLGDTPGLEITTSERMHERISVDERDGTLTLDAEAVVGWPDPVTYVLTVSSLDSVMVDGSGSVDADFTTGVDVTIDLDGSGSVSARGLEVGAVSVSLRGSGSVVLAGTAEMIDATLDGSGSVEAIDLIARSGTVELDGSGSIGVHATSEMDAELEGSGTIRVAGSPRLSEQVRGSGDIVEVR